MLSNILVHYDVSQQIIGCILQLPYCDANTIQVVVNNKVLVHQALDVTTLGVPNDYSIGLSNDHHYYFNNDYVNGHLDFNAHTHNRAHTFTIITDLNIELQSGWSAQFCNKTIMPPTIG